MMLPNLLIVDDEKNTRDTLEQLFRDDYEVYLARNYEEAVTLLKRERFDIVLTDLRMAGKNGMCVVEEALHRPYNPVCIMMSAYGSVEVAVEAIKQGAYDFVTKPLDFEKLSVMMRQALMGRKNKSKIKGESPTKTEKIADFSFSPQEIIGHSGPLQEVLEKIKKVAPTKATVLLEGETGTGKELFAHAVHFFSKRAQGPFVSVHCASLQKNLLESELFGHEKGAFTGADARRIGLFEAAHTGTIFFDEIGEIDLSTQVKLLRFLETHTFSRVGSSETLSVDVRVVCATNRDRSKMVTEGTFREDLFYRLNVVTIPIPPLRQRGQDLELLLQFYIQKFAQENEGKEVTFSPEVIAQLRRYRWSGNVRELRNFCESSVIFYGGQQMQLSDLDPKFFCESLLVPSK